jgi:hypothetical protein
MDMNTHDQLTTVAFNKTTYATKHYSSKLPRRVNDAMWQFSGNHTLAVRKLEQTLGLSQAEGNCHRNVLAHVAAHGGEIVSGWMLENNAILVNKGLLIWSFHSVWRTKEGLLIDVTNDSSLPTSNRTIFLVDCLRKYDSINGIAYNNVVILTNPKLACHVSENVGVEMSANKVYWMNNDMTDVRKLTDHSGQYRLVSPEFPENRELLEQRYGAVIKPDGSVAFKYGSKNCRDVMFEFGIGGR